MEIKEVRVVVYDGPGDLEVTYTRLGFGNFPV